MATDYPRSFENLENFLMISDSSHNNLPAIQKRLAAGFACAFLVTADFSIHIGATNKHGDIYNKFSLDSNDRDAIIEKGSLSPKAQLIQFYTTGTQMPADIKGVDLEKLKGAIQYKINEFLGTHYH